jgi:hypothetical protein
MDDGEELPERLRDGDEANDNRDDDDDGVPSQDLGVPSRLPGAAGGAMGFDMSHSVFGMLQVAATQMDDDNEREGASSSDDGEDGGGGRRKRAGGAALGTQAMRGLGHHHSGGLMARSLWHDRSSAGVLSSSPSTLSSSKASGVEGSSGKKHRRRISESKMFRSLLHPRSLSSKKGGTKEGDESSAGEADERTTQPAEGAAPQLAAAAAATQSSVAVYDDMDADPSQSLLVSPPEVGAVAESPSAELSDTVPPLPAAAVTAASRMASSSRRGSDARGEASGDEDDGGQQLALRLQQVFEFDHVEEVVNGEFFSGVWVFGSRGG